MSMRDICEFFYFRRFFKRTDKIYLRRRSVLLIVFGILVLYLISLVFRNFHHGKPKQEDLSSQCIDRFLQLYRKEVVGSDSSVWIPARSSNTENSEQSSSSSTTNFLSAYYGGDGDGDFIPQPPKNAFIPLVGNGKFSITPHINFELHDTDTATFYVMGKRILDIPIPFDPIVHVDDFGTHTKSALVMRYLHGTVEKITCTNYGGGVISVHETFSAHRLIPVLFTQEIRISNPTNAPLILNLQRKGWMGKSLGPPKPLRVTTKDHREYSVIVASVDSDQNHGIAKKFSSHPDKAQAVAIAYPALHQTIEVHPNDRFSMIVHTFINHTAVFKHESEMQAAIPDLKISLRETVKKTLEMSDTALKQYHETAWHQLWSSGFSISHSHAPNSVNGYRINGTLYYLLSQRQMPWINHGEDSIMKNMNSAELSGLTETEPSNGSLMMNIYKPDRCYHGHSTFHASKLWSRLDSLMDAQHVIRLWFLTLEKQSCEHLIQANAKGVLQAFLLSLVGLRFTPRHLEFHSHPADLQRHFLIRRLAYDENSLLNISVRINEDNKALIQVALDATASNKEYYACDAGCLDAPVRLARHETEFPVKLTDPLTPLLYITNDREHIKELKHSIHVKEIGEAPPHEHKTIAMHRYGHSLGGLPNFFWIAIIFLIIVFHLFLGKLIYNEYFNMNHIPYERVPYRNIGRYSM